MTTNLSPEYKDAEQAFRAAKDPAERLSWLERMLATIPKHKGTEKMQADLKRRISKLKEGQEVSGSKKGFSVRVEAEGAAQVALIGSPNVGKSALVEVTTNARVEVADFPFSTREPVPAMLHFENLQFQLVDLPPVSREHMESFVPEIIRNADCALWLIDASVQDVQRWVDETVSALIEKKVDLVGSHAQGGGRQDPVRKLPTLILASKMDVKGAQTGLDWLRQRFEPAFGLHPVSAMADNDFSWLGKALFDLNQLLRAYSKPPGKEPDPSLPFVMHRGDRLIDFATRVHKDFAAKLKYARVWGKGKFDGQRISANQELTDGDVIELHL
jgi:uncharacterized protein